MDWFMSKQLRWKVEHLIDEDVLAKLFRYQIFAFAIETAPYWNGISSSDPIVKFMYSLKMNASVGYALSLEATLTQIVIDGSKNPFAFFTPKDSHPFFLSTKFLPISKKVLTQK